MVLDIDQSEDQLGTMKTKFAPNFRRAKGDLPIYGMGQPTQNGINEALESIRDDNSQDIIFFKFRNEPVIFVRDNYDMIPYSPREKHNIHTPGDYDNMTDQDICHVEVLLRKEVSALSTTLISLSSIISWIML